MWVKRANLNTKICQRIFSDVTTAKFSTVLGNQDQTTSTTGTTKCHIGICILTFFTTLYSNFETNMSSFMAYTLKFKIFCGTHWKLRVMYSIPMSAEGSKRLKTR